MQDVKKQFINYLRQVYGADSMVTDQGLPPMETGPNYPAFRDHGMNAGLGMFGGMMSPGMGMQGGMGGPMASQGAFQRPRLGGPRGELDQAQDVLLGR